MQREFIGRGQISVIAEELTQLGGQRVLLVSTGNSYRSCGAKEIIEPRLGGFSLTVFDEFTPNPTYDEVMAGVDCFIREGCNVILAIGGGSAIDMAKSINALQANPGVERKIVTGEIKINQPLTPLIAVPTTAGTGSEATHFAVIYLKGKKYSIASPYLLPDVAIIDVTFTDSLPPYITACSGFDALCQAIESYWSENGNEESRKFAQEAIELLLKYLPESVSCGAPVARENVIRAANWAGKAINISKTTAPHALSYTITSKFGVPHGHAVALTLGEFFTLHEKPALSGINSKLSITMKNLFAMLEVDNAEQAKSKWYELMDICGLEKSLTKNGIKTNADVWEIVEGVNAERLGNHPIKLSTEMLVDVFSDRLGLPKDA